ncbi:MAG: hypothetical protein methR_P2404 [Methyloprofundus sp.]|nr:MAG: hypothetical protein methR_P2404 [Methyloprofundus sp.]
MTKFIDLVVSERDKDLGLLLKDLFIKGAGVDSGTLRLITEDSNCKEIISNDSDTVLPIILITSGFYESPYCMGLLGSYIAYCGESVYPIVFPPVDFNDLRGMLVGVQVEDVEDESVLFNIIKRLELFIGYDVSIKQWKVARNIFIKKYEGIKPTINYFSLRNRFPSDPRSNIYDEVRALCSAFNMSGGFWGFSPYPILISSGNGKTIFIDISKEYHLSFNPNTLNESHDSLVKSAQLKNHPCPWGLITLKVQPLGHPVSPIPEVDKDKSVEFYRYIDWWAPESRDQFINILKELKGMS